MSIDFKDNATLISVNQIQIQNHSMDSGSESAFIGSWSSSSSSSFLTTSFESELDSNDADLDDGDEDEFIAQLTRQMADYMLEENDDVEVGDENRSSKHSSLQKRSFQEPIPNKNHEQARRSYADTVKKSIAGFQPEQSVTVNEQLQPPIQLYQVENQPRVGRGRKGKLSESTQHMKPHRHEQMHSNRSFRSGNSAMHHVGIAGSASNSVRFGKEKRFTYVLNDGDDTKDCACVNCLAVLKPSKPDNSSYLFTWSHDGTLKRWELNE